MTPDFPDDGAAEAQADLLMHEAAEVMALLDRLPPAAPARAHLRDRLDELQRRIGFLTGAPCAWGDAPAATILPAPKAA